MSSPQDVGGVVVSEEQRGGARVRGVMAKFGRGINHPKVKNLPNIQRSGNRGTPMVPGSLPGHATGSQMVQLGSSRRVTLYSASITAWSVVSSCHVSIPLSSIIPRSSTRACTIALHHA